MTTSIRCAIQFSTDMDSLELHLKLDRMDPALVPDSSIKHKNELHQTMTADWTEVDSKGKQLAKDAAEVNLCKRNKAILDIRFRPPPVSNSEWVLAGLSR